jgi:hypothetical protein
MDWITISATVSATTQGNATKKATNIFMSYATAS